MCEMFALSEPRLVLNGDDPFVRVLASRYSRPTIGPRTPGERGTMTTNDRGAVQACELQRKLAWLGFPLYRIRFALLALAVLLTAAAVLFPAQQLEHRRLINLDTRRNELARLFSARFQFPCCTLGCDATPIGSKPASRAWRWRFLIITCSSRKRLGDTAVCCLGAY